MVARLVQTLCHMRVPEGMLAQPVHDDDKAFWLDILSVVWNRPIVKRDILPVACREGGKVGIGAHAGWAAITLATAAVIFLA